MFEYLEKQPHEGYPEELSRARDWVWSRIDTSRLKVGKPYPSPIIEACALLASVFVADPDAARNEARVPNMVRLMILPWAL